MKTRWVYFLEEVLKLEVIRLSPVDLLAFYDSWVETEMKILKGQAVEKMKDYIHYSPGKESGIYRWKCESCKIIHLFTEEELEQITDRCPKEIG